MVFLAPEPPITELLDVPEADDPAFVHGALEPIRARVGAGLMIDNFLDMAHFPFVHAATIGTPGVGDVRVRRRARRASGCACTAAIRSRTAKTPASPRASVR